MSRFDHMPSGLVRWAIFHLSRSVAEKQGRIVAMRYRFGYTPLGRPKMKLTDDDWIGLFFVIMLGFWCPALLLVFWVNAGRWFNE